MFMEDTSMFSLDPDFLRSFLAIYETGSYGAAAAHVNKTQSTVSAQMKRIEEILGVTLFEKVGRRNILSPEGKRLVEYARPLVRLNDETVSAFRPPAISGAIKIGTCDDYAQAFLPPILSRFAYTHPAIEVEIVTADTAELLRRTDIEPFDALLVSSSQRDLDVEVLRTDRLHWIGSDRFSCHQEEKLPLALWSEGCSWRGKALAALAQGGRHWRLAYTTSNAPLLLATVRDGLGITVGPRWYLDTGLKILDDLDTTCPLGTDGLGIHILPGAKSGPLEPFLDHVRTHFREEGKLAVA